MAFILYLKYCKKKKKKFVSAKGQWESKIESKFYMDHTIPRFI